MTLFPHRFRPPKKTDTKGWQVVKFLLEHGFSFQHINEEDLNSPYPRSSANYVAYPKNLQDAKEFVEKYKEQAQK